MFLLDQFPGNINAFESVAMAAADAEIHGAGVRRPRREEVDENFDVPIFEEPTDDDVLRSARRFRGEEHEECRVQAKDLPELGKILRSRFFPNGIDRKRWTHCAYYGECVAKIWARVQRHGIKKVWEVRAVLPQWL